MSLVEDKLAEMGVSNPIDLLVIAAFVNILDDITSNPTAWTAITIAAEAQFQEDHGRESDDKKDASNLSRHDIKRLVAFSLLTMLEEEREKDPTLSRMP